MNLSPRIRRTSIAVGGVAAALILLDLLLRLLGAGVPPGPFCPDGAPRGDHRYLSRNPYVDTPPDDVTEYVPCFGDSWTFGPGVPRGEVWPARLETALTRHGEPIRVVNLATADATTGDVARIFRQQMKRYRARRAVVFVGARDATPVDLLAAYPPGDPWRPEDCSRPWWRLAHLAGRRLAAMRLAAHPLDPPESPPDVPRVTGVGEAQENLLAVAAQAHDLNARVLFVLYPDLPARQSARPYLPLENRYNFLARAAAASFDDPVCDLQARWGAHTADFLLPWMRWPHPNAAGHADIALAVAGTL